MVQKQRTTFNRILKDLHEHACDGMLISFINTLIETVIMTMPELGEMKWVQKILIQF